jgi:hypothetical protein
MDMPVAVESPPSPLDAPQDVSAVGDLHARLLVLPGSSPDTTWPISPPPACVVGGDLIPV